MKNNIQDKTKLVNSVFSKVYRKYDLMNDIMSLGIHRIWKTALVDWLSPRNGQDLLDVAGGTGDIAFRFLKRAPKSRVTVLDMTEKMLVEGKRRAEAHKFKENIDWIKPFEKIHNGEFANTSWFEGGQLNISINCIDRHLPKNANKNALIWEGDNPSESKNIPYQELHDQVCKLSNALKELGVKKGSRVCIYMPMIPEASYAMLACARIGAIHSVVFGGFSPEALKDRIIDADCSIVITADEGYRGGKKVPLKNNVDIALQKCPRVKTNLVIKRTGGQINWNKEIDVWYHDIVVHQKNTFDPEPMDSEDALFILYTSGSTGKPKGVMHTTAGYLLGAHISFKYLFGYQQDDNYWCTADVGWITGHTYIVYGPLSNGATSLMFEGCLLYTSPSPRDRG